VPRAEWKPLFDRLSKSLLGKQAEIEVASLDLGDQIAVEWVPMIGISYDPNDDRIDVILDRTNHAISHPTEIRIDQSSAGLSSIAILDRDGESQVIRLKDPLGLPAATKA
jgi:hypothetical protein